MNIESANSAGHAALKLPRFTEFESFWWLVAFALNALVFGSLPGRLGIIAAALAYVIGTPAVGALMGFFRPEKPWRWGVAAGLTAVLYILPGVLGNPIFFNSLLIHLVLALPAAAAAYFGAWLRLETNLGASFTLPSSSGISDRFNHAEYLWLCVAGVTGAAFSASNLWMRLASLFLIVAMVDFLRPEKPWRWGGTAAGVAILTSLACLFLIPLHTQILAVLALPIFFAGAICWNLTRAYSNLTEQLSNPPVKTLLFAAILTGVIPGLFQNPLWHYALILLAFTAGFVHSLAQHWRAALWITTGYVLGVALKATLGLGLNGRLFDLNLFEIGQAFVYGGAVVCAGVYAGAAIRWTYQRRGFPAEA